MATSSSTPPLTVLEGFSLHTENSAHILLPATKDAFLNPVQEFNRDLSVACIRVWSEDWNAQKEERWRRAQEHKPAKAKKGKGKGEVQAEPPAEGEPDSKRPKSLYNYIGTAHT
jgi:tRNA (guanine26-N2/guanine27-N2)-dimethyltransferase